jgi:hypothetical protein
MRHPIFYRLLAAFFGLFLFSSGAQATLLSDLQALNTQASDLQFSLSALQVSGSTICAPLVQATQQARALTNSITQVNDSLVGPISLDADILNALDQLSTTSLGLANEGLRLSVDLDTLSATAQALTIKDGITAMLQLSDDIGTMADRIGEMSDKILVMSDNIGLMADRILVTQQLQSDNLTVVTQTALQTQTNALTLVKVVEDASYDLSMASLITQGNLLAAKMTAVVFNPLTMAGQAAAIATDVKNFKEAVKSFQQTVIAGAAQNTMTVNYDTLAGWVSMAAMQNSLTTALYGYQIAISGLQAITSAPTLEASLTSMLQMSADIGTMSNRILEMADQILLMADNIGMQADQIVATQAAMNVNIATSQQVTLSTQGWAIALIVARGL